MDFSGLVDGNSCIGAFFPGDDVFSVDGKWFDWSILGSWKASCVDERKQCSKEKSDYGKDLGKMTWVGMRRKV